MRTHPFWAFSLHLYAQAGVESACLALQEEGADVNLLLLCCWLGGTGRRLDRRRLRSVIAAVASWQEQIVVPLRLVRRNLKRESWRVSASGRRALRQHLATAELQAEHLEQLLLASQVADLPRRAGKNFAAENLAGYGALLGLAADAGQYLQVLLSSAGGANSLPC